MQWMVSTNATVALPAAVDLESEDADTSAWSFQISIGVGVTFISGLTWRKLDAIRLVGSP